MSDDDHGGVVDSPTAERRSGRRIGVAVYGEIAFDSRVRREAASLYRAGFDVTLTCFAGSASPDIPPGVDIVLVPQPPGAARQGIGNPFSGAGGISRLLARIRWLVAYARGVRAWGRSAVAAAGPVDAWHVHDLPALIAIARATDGLVPIVYDSHEIFLEAGTGRRLPGPARAILRWYEGRLVSRAAALVTVNDELAVVFQQRYRPRRTVVVHNCPGRWTRPNDAADFLRHAAAIPPGSDVVLYHGVVGPGRGVDLLFEVMLEPGLGNCHLAIMGMGDTEPYVAAAAASPARERIHFLPPVEPAELLDWVEGADVGAVVIQATTLNHYLSTPNKLFECIAAGVPVVASDFPAMRRVVRGDDDDAGSIGALCDPDDTSAIAAAIRSILVVDPSARAELRARCSRSAERRWNWDHEVEGLVAMYRRILEER